MKIKLLADYRGVLTNEQFFEAGELDAGPGLPMSEGMANALVAEGRAEVVPSKVRRASRKRATRKKKAS